MYVRINISLFTIQGKPDCLPQCKSLKLILRIKIRQIIGEFELRVSEKYPNLTIEYPFKITTAIIYLAISVPCLLMGLFLLLIIFLGGEPLISIPSIMGIVLIIIGIIILIILIRTVTTPDRIVINRESRQFTRFFGLGSLYGNSMGTEVTYDFNSVTELFLNRKIHFIPTTQGPPAPLYYIFCGFRDLESKEMLLHAGYRDSVDTAKYLAKTFEKDVIDYSGLEKRTVPNNNLERLNEIRYPPIGFIKNVIFRFMAIVGLFLTGVLIPLIVQDILTGSLKSLINQLSGMFLLISIILFVAYSIWLFKTAPIEKMRCRQCGTLFAPEEVSCSHCGLNIALMRTREFDPNDYIVE